MMMSIKVGITGGIGSGKSTVCKVFEQLGIPVYVADLRAKLLLQTHPEIKHELSALLGADIYLENGSIDRGRMASIIFNDSSVLARVNEIVHPRVHNDFEAWAALQTSPFVLKEAAILFESGSHLHVHKSIVVTANEGLRIRRVQLRDNCSEQQVRDRMKNQWPEERKVALADFVIRNDDTELVIEQVLAVYRTIVGKVESHIS